MKLRLTMGAAILGGAVFFGGPAHAEDAPPTSTIEPSPSTSAPAAGSKRTVWPWVIMGTGVALIVTAVVLEVKAVREDDKRESEEVKLTGFVSRPANDPEKSALQKSIDDHSSSASSERTAALIVGTVGFLAVAGSVILWFVEGSSSAPAPAARLKPTFTPALSPGYAGARLGLSF